MVDQRLLATGDFVIRRNSGRVYEVFRHPLTTNPNATGVLLFPIEGKRRAIAPPDRALRDYRRVLP